MQRCFLANGRSVLDFMRKDSGIFYRIGAENLDLNLNKLEVHTLLNRLYFKIVQ